MISGTLKLYLNSPLKDLTIWAGDACQNTETKVDSHDDVWLKHIGATCFKLQSLPLEIVLEAGPGEVLYFAMERPSLLHAPHVPPLHLREDRIEAIYLAIHSVDAEEPGSRGSHSG